MSKSNESRDLPISPDIVCTIEGELEARRLEDSDQVVMEDDEYEGWREGPEEEGGGDSEEPLRKRVVPKVNTPTKTEIEEHEKTHLPFRTWCKSCVKGRGVASPHCRVGRDDPKAPGIEIDYCFPRAGITILGVRDNQSGATASIWVPKKGGTISWIAEHLTNMIDYEWGRSKIIFKSDGEPAILDLKRLIHEKRRHHQTIFDRSLVDDHQSNGKAENMIREIEGMIRTWRNHLEGKYGIKIETSNPIFPWMVRFGGEVITRFKKGPDGLTPYERLKEKKPRTRGAMLGEKVMFLPVKDAKNKKDKMDDIYDEGIWVGTSNVDGASILLTPEGPRVSRSLRQLPDKEKYDPVFLMLVRGSPWELDGHMIGDQPDAEEAQEVPERAKEDIPEHVPVIEAIPSRTRITKADLAIHGYTEGCLGCRNVQNNAKKVQAHNEVCRERMYPLMKATDDGKVRVDEAEFRRKDWERRAEDIENQVAAKKRRVDKSNAHRDKRVRARCIGRSRARAKHEIQEGTYCRDESTGRKLGRIAKDCASYGSSGYRQEWARRRQRQQQQQQR